MRKVFYIAVALLPLFAPPTWAGKDRLVRTTHRVHPYAEAQKPKAPLHTAHLVDQLRSLTLTHHQITQVHEMSRRSEFAESVFDIPRTLRTPEAQDSIVTMKSRWLGHLYAAQRFQNFSPFSGPAPEEGYLNLNHLFDPTLSQTLFQHMPRLPWLPGPVNAPALRQKLIRELALLAPHFPNGEIRLKRNDRDWSLPDLLRSALTKGTHASFLLLHKRTMRLIQEITRYLRVDLSYAEGLFDSLVDASSACYDNALFQLDRAEEALLFHALRSLDPKDHLKNLLAFGLHKFKQHTLRTAVLENYFGMCWTSGESVEGYLYAHRLTQYSLRLSPIYSHSFVHATAFYSPLSYLQLIQAVVEQWTASHLVAYLCAMSELDAGDRMTAYHQYCCDRAPLVAEHLDPDWIDAFPLALRPHAISDLKAAGILVSSPHYPVRPPTFSMPWTIAKPLSAKSRAF